MSELAKKIRRNMTIEQQVSMCSGADFWHTQAYPELGIDSVTMADGPHGMRVEQKRDGLDIAESAPATCFPPAVLSACSWNPSLIADMAAAIAQEAKALGVDIILGPGLNIKRIPLCGRNFEYFSEDPYLSGTLGGAYANGVAEENVGVCMKHYAVNNQELRRMTVDAIVDERTMREIYLKVFEIAVTIGKPAAVMSAYNAVNGEFLSQNKALIHGVLRNEWGFDKLVMTDWAAAYNRVKGIKATVDLAMPGNNGYYDASIIKALQNGHLKRRHFNMAVEHSIDFALDATKRRQIWDTNQTVNFEAHHNLARKIAEESIVLLKNANSILPLDTNANGKLAIIGKMAFDPRIQGEGSSKINVRSIDTPYEAIKQIFGHSLEVSASPGYSDHDEERNTMLLESSRQLAHEADWVILFLGLPPETECEGFDRSNMKLPENQRQLLSEVSASNSNTVVIYMNGSVVDLEGSENVAGIIEAWLGGEAIGTALANVLSGKVNPSGRLAETIPMKLEDTPAYDQYPGVSNQMVYGEGVFVGYRYYDHRKQAVRYPFGFGLSYTTFDYDQIVVTPKGDNTFELSCCITNTGNCDGQTVVQVYVGKIDSSISRPVRELRAFKKISLAVDESEVISFILTERDFTYYNTELGIWATEPGQHCIEVAESSRDIRQSCTVDINRNYIPEITLYSYLSDVLEHPKGKQLVSVLSEQVEKLFGQKLDDLDQFAQSVTYSTPLYKLAAYSRGMVTEGMVDTIIDFLNDLEHDDPFDLSVLMTDGLSDKGGWITSIVGYILGMFGAKSKLDYYSVDDRVADLLDNPETLKLLKQYCPAELIESEQARTVAKMGLTLRKVQKLAASQFFPAQLLEEIDQALKMIKKEK